MPGHGKHAQIKDSNVKAVYPGDTNERVVINVDVNVC